MRIVGQTNVPFKTQQFVLLAAQAGNFHRAARILGVDPSVIVRSIERLESDLGTHLFIRTRSRFSVTEGGRCFVREIQKAVWHVERACDLARYQARIEMGPFRLGYSGYIHSRLLPLLETLDHSISSPSERLVDSVGVTTSIHSESKVVLESGTTMQLIDRVQRGELHAALGVQPLPEEEDLSTEDVTREAFCVCVSKNHRLAKQPAVLVREMDGEMVFFLPRGAHPGLYDRTVEYIGSTGARPVLREVMTLTHAIEIVSHNFGIALLPRSAARLSHMGVLFKPVADKLLWVQTTLFSRRDPGNDRLRWFRHRILARLRSGALDR